MLLNAFAKTGLFVNCYGKVNLILCKIPATLITLIGLFSTPEPIKKFFFKTGFSTGRFHCHLAFEQKHLSGKHFQHFSHNCDFFVLSTDKPFNLIMARFGELC